MGLTIACPGCKSNISVSDSVIGRWIACPKCGMEFAAMRSEAATDEAEVEYHPPPSASPFRILGWAAVGSLIALAVFFFVGAAISSKRARDMAEKLPERLRPNQAQTRSNADPAKGFHDSDTERGLFLGLGILFWFVIFSIAYLVALILMLAWVARDSRSRGVDGGAVWVITVLFTGFVGLLVYLASRPHGILVVCEHCYNKKLNYARLCPHCGHKVRSRARRENSRDD
jgi:hypothetical protein